MAFFNDSDYAKIHFSSIDNIGPSYTEQCNKLVIGATSYFFVPNDIKLYDEKSNHIMHVLYNANFWNVLSVLKLNTLDSLDIYSFGMTTNNNENACHFYLSNILLLERFIDYYNHKTADFITKIDKKSFANFHQTFNFGQNDLPYETEKVKQFLQATQYDTKYIRYNDNNTVLSPRQIECLKYLSEGYNMKRIASVLNLSPRTVEFYLNSIKTKTGCTSTKALISSYVKSALPS